MSISQRIKQWPLESNWIRKYYNFDGVTFMRIETLGKERSSLRKGERTKVNLVEVPRDNNGKKKIIEQIFEMFNKGYCVGREGRGGVDKYYILQVFEEVLNLNSTNPNTSATKPYVLYRIDKSIAKPVAEPVAEPGRRRKSSKSGGNEASSSSVAKLVDELTAFLFLRFDGNVAHIDLVCSIPKAVRTERGLAESAGSAVPLMFAAFEIARNENARYIKLEGVPKALEYYKRYGFTYNSNTKLPPEPGLEPMSRLVPNHPNQNMFFNKNNVPLRVPKKYDFGYLTIKKSVRGRGSILPVLVLRVYSNDHLQVLVFDNTITKSKKGTEPTYTPNPHVETVSDWQSWKPFSSHVPLKSSAGYPGYLQVRELLRSIAR